MQITVAGGGPLTGLATALAELTPPPAHPALEHLVNALVERHRDCAQSVLFYGSCLRGGDPFDGLVDLYLIVDSYRAANSSRSRAFWNWLLPPNVFYAEFPFEGQTLRCKYAVLTPADFAKGTSNRWFHSYLWGRFSQPTALAWARDRAARDQALRSMARAIVTFLNRSLPGVAAQGTIASLWEEALALSYGTELRPESRDRAKTLTTTNLPYYTRVTRLAAGALKYPLCVNSENQYDCPISPLTRTGNRIGWRIRALQGKALSLARLCKALLTFDGGLDYIAWKLERHSGQKIVIPDRVRRYPLVFVWGMMWRLYQQGVFR